MSLAQLIRIDGNRGRLSFLSETGTGDVDKTLELDIGPSKTETENTGTRS